MSSIPLLTLSTLLVLSACDRSYPANSLRQNAAAAYTPCSESEIRFLAAKHNFQTAFRECGSNNFNHYAWSPEGTHLYFSFTLTHHIMDAGAENKATITVPTESPTGDAGWLSSSTIAIPVGPAEDGGSPRLAVYDMTQNSLFHHDLPGLTEVDEVFRGDKSSDVLFSAVKDGARSVWRLDLDDDTLEPAFPWLQGSLDTFTYTHQAQAAAMGRGSELTLYRAGDGAELGSWEPATRGVLHPDGRYLALEHEGEAISIFYQRAWDELSEKARERELRRAKEFEDRLPAWYPSETNPPTISMVDLTTGDRWVFTGFFGHHFQWYEARPYYSSLLLWGFEGKELNKNVLLGDLADRLRSMEREEQMMGFEPWVVPGQEPVPQPEGTPSEALEGSVPADEAEAEENLPPAVQLQ